MSGIERVKPDFSVRMTVGTDEILINRIFDHVHLFRWLDHGILKLITQEGFVQYHVSLEHAEKVARAAGIIAIERTEISEREHESYLTAMGSFMTDEWLAGTAEGHPEPSEDTPDEVE